MHYKGGDSMPRKRNNLINFRLNDEELNKLEIKINKSGLSKQEYIRSCCLDKKIYERLNLDYFKLINEINHLGNNQNQIARTLNSDNEVLDNLIIENQESIKSVLKELNNQLRGTIHGNN